jgi:hypothetical protein
VFAALYNSGVIVTFEKPRKGNPLEFVIDQHFHTAHAIAKFYNNDEKVEVFMKDSEETIQRHKRAKIFCAKRNWDERAERGYMTEIESNFHAQIDNLVSFKNRDHKAISEYFVLWRLRHLFHIERLSDAPLHGVQGEDLTKEQQEALEKIGWGYVNENGEIPARQLTGGQIQLGVMGLMDTTFSKMKWGLLKARKGQFLCSDSYQKLCILPISPKYVFAGNLSDETLDHNKVALVNKESIESATEFYFSKSLRNCPVA